MTLFIDIETRLAADPRAGGAYVHAEHPSTEVTIISWAVDNNPAETWLPPRKTWQPSPDLWMSHGFMMHAGGEMPRNLRDALKFHVSPAAIVAYNAGFERTVL